MDRGAWVDQGAFTYPIAGDSLGFVYEHESTTLSNSPDLGTAVPFATSGPIQIGNGDNYVQCNQILPDEEANTLPGVTLSFKGKFTPLGPTTDFGSFTFESDGYTDARCVPDAPPPKAFPAEPTFASTYSMSPYPASCFSIARTVISVLSMPVPSGYSTMTLQLTG